jgi:hypothetical protein
MLIRLGSVSDTSTGKFTRFDAPDTLALLIVSVFRLFQAKLYQPAGTISRIVAEADLVVSATLVAVTVTVCCELMVDGGVYSPVGEMVPTFGFRAQVTAVLLVLITVAVNCCVWLAASVASGGVKETTTGGTTRVTLVESRELPDVPITVIV